MLTNWLLDAEPTPKLLVLPPDAVDLGEAEAAIELWEHYSGKTLDPTQRLSVQVMLALGADGKWAASTTGREMPRQNGKGDEIEVVELWGLVQRAERIAHTIHEAVLLATQTQQRMLAVLEGHADLRRRILRKWQGTGQQMIEMRNGGIIWYRTRSNGGSRGVDDVDRIVVDEAQHATEEQLAAVSPTGFANRNPQLNAFGTGGLEGMSRWWWGMRKRALSDDPGKFGYVGHTAETVYLDADGRVVQEPVDASDRSLWPLANPAIVSGRGRMEFLEEQFRNLPDLFAREHLGVWDPPPPDDIDAPPWELWSEAEWERAAIDHGERFLADPVTLAVEVDYRRSRAYVCAAGALVDGDGVGFDVVATHPGVAWVAQHIARLCADESRPVRRVLMVSPSEKDPDPLVAEMTDLGVTVDLVRMPELAAATAGFYDAVLEQRARHRRTPELTECVSRATWRPYGSAGARLIDRRTGVDTSPITGCIVAHAGHLKGEPESAPAGFAFVLGGS